jgi:hypothetical protein
VPRKFSPPGVNAGKAATCEQRSGEALNRIQFLLSAETAIDDWVRRRLEFFEVRAARQLGQLQFHCGTPPPAAEPRTRTFTGIKNKASRFLDLALSTNRRDPELLADVDVGSDFHGEADFFKFRLDPCIHNYLFPRLESNLFSAEMQEMF